METGAAREALIDVLTKETGLADSDELREAVDRILAELWVRGFAIREIPENGP